MFRRFALSKRRVMSGSNREWLSGCLSFGVGVSEWWFSPRGLRWWHAIAGIVLILWSIICSIIKTFEVILIVWILHSMQCLELFCSHFQAWTCHQNRQQKPRQQRKSFNRYSTAVSNPNTEIPRNFSNPRHYLCATLGDAAPDGPWLGLSLAKIAQPRLSDSKGRIVRSSRW